MFVVSRRERVRLPVLEHLPVDLLSLAVHPFDLAVVQQPEPPYVARGVVQRLRVPYLAFAAKPLLHLCNYFAVMSDNVVNYRVPHIPLSQELPFFVDDLEEITASI